MEKANIHLFIGDDPNACKAEHYPDGKFCGRPRNHAAHSVAAAIDKAESSFAGLAENCQPLEENWEGNALLVVPRELRQRIAARERERIAEMIGVRAQLCIDQGFFERAGILGELAREIRELAE